MTLFLDILTKVTLPIITLVVLGYALQSRLKLDIGTLNRIQIYVVMPAFLINFLASAKQPLSAIWPVLGVGFLLFTVLIPIGWIIAAVFRQRSSLGPMIGLGSGYANVGFFGIPVAQLAFGSGTVIYMTVMTVVATVLICTVGVALLAPAGASKLGKLKSAFSTPLMPSVALGLTLRGFDVELPPVVSQPMVLLSSIFTPLALYTLGAQVAESKIDRFEPVPQIILLAQRFLIAPALAWGLCHLFGFSHDITSVLVVAAATPVGVLLTIFAMEYKTEPEFISAAVVISTALSPIFVTAWVIAMRMLQ
jgi:malate permease and related proteins